MGQPDHPDRLRLAEYRARAVEALEKAALSSDEVLRASWENVAESYQDMADRLERTLKPL